MNFYEKGIDQMDKFIMVNEKPVYVVKEGTAYYELVEFAPDGEEIRYVVSKDQCDYTESGLIKANHVELQFF